jgi:hypothetical protein
VINKSDENNFTFATVIIDANRTLNIKMANKTNNLKIVVTDKNENIY